MDQAVNDFDPTVYAQQVAADGFTIVPSAYPAEELDDVIAAMEEVYERERPIAERFGEQSDNHRVVRNIIGKHQLFETFYSKAERVLAVCRAVLGEDMVLYDTTARSIQPSGGRDRRHGFQVHVDRGEFTVEPFKGAAHVVVALNVVWALVDFSAENGATTLWPGTHVSLEVPDDAAGDDPGAVTAEMPAGSAVLWDAALWHATGLNHSDHARHSVLGFFQRQWVKGVIDNERILPPELRARLTPDTRALLGLDQRLPDYSSVRALSGSEIDSLSPWEKDVVGIGIY